jgi:hypothetical protein
MSDIEEKATTIANIETEEGPVEVIDDAEPTSTGIDASKINPPTNEDELVALVNVLGLDWKKIAESCTREET